MAAVKDELQQAAPSPKVRPGAGELSTDDWASIGRESRLSIPAPLRITVGFVTALAIGGALGVSYGSHMGGLRFRAEHAHRLPTSATGWYMYHKSKNYHLAYGGLKEGLKTGFRLSGLSLAFFCTEHLFDVYRGYRDMLNTVGASLAVAGGFSLINRFSAAETARTARKGLMFGLVYGGIQDLLSLARGRPVGYVDFVRKHLGNVSKSAEQQLGS